MYHPRLGQYVRQIRRGSRLMISESDIRERIATEMRLGGPYSLAASNSCYLKRLCNPPADVIGSTEMLEMHMRLLGSKRLYALWLTTFW